MDFYPLNILRDIVKTLDERLFGPAVSQLFPACGMTTSEQIDQLPILRRGIHWDDQGRMFVTEIRRCDLTGTHFKRVREITE